MLDLQQQLHEKDMKLTDIRLEALSSAAQLEQLRDTMNRMKVWTPMGFFCLSDPVVVLKAIIQVYFVK